MRRLISPIAVAAVAAGLLAGQAGHAQSGGVRTLVLSTKDVSTRIIDLPPRGSGRGGRASQGDEVVSLASVTDASRARLGTRHAVCVVTRAARTIGGATFHCSISYALRDGTLFGESIGSVTASEIRTSVTGGTGAYVGARGDGLARQTSENRSQDTITLQG
jgi:hypothetical protein